MSKRPFTRPTENKAIGATRTPPRLNVQQILLDRAAARTRMDRLGDHLLGGLLSRALGVKAAS